MTLGERVRRLRTERALSQSELATAAGVTKLTISRIERDVKFPHPKTLRGIAQALSVQPSELADPDEVMERRRGEEAA
jgi:transcriptional regulator with XRE-family HTH domain